jgi:hypothetical protein
MQRMPDDDVDKFLADEKSVEVRRKQLIDALLKKRDAQNKEIDDQLAKLGHHEGSKPKRNHHKKAAPATDAKAKG